MRVGVQALRRRKLEVAQGRPLLEARYAAPMALGAGREWTWCVPQQPIGASGTSYIDGLFGVCEGVQCALQPRNGREGVVVSISVAPGSSREAPWWSHHPCGSQHRLACQALQDVCRLPRQDAAEEWRRVKLLVACCCVQRAHAKHEGLLTACCPILATQVLLTSGPQAGELCRLGHAALLIWQEPGLSPRSALAAPLDHLLETHASVTTSLLGASTRCAGCQFFMRTC